MFEVKWGLVYFAEQLPLPSADLVWRRLQQIQLPVNTATSRQCKPLAERAKTGTYSLIENAQALAHRADEREDATERRWRNR